MSSSPVKKALKRQASARKTKVARKVETKYNFASSNLAILSIVSLLVLTLSPFNAGASNNPNNNTTGFISLTVTDGEGNSFSLPHTFDCTTSPLYNPITITGSGSGSTPPGHTSQYHVSVDWGDGTVDQQTETSGIGSYATGDGAFNFTFTGGPHTYTTTGTQTLTVTIYHQTGSGNDNQSDATSTVNLCVHVPPSNNGTVIISKTVASGSAQPADFTFKVGDTTVPLNTPTDIPQGTYAVTESGPTGYTPSFSSDCANGSISIVANQVYNCDIVNNYSAPANGTLVVTKDTVNGDGTFGFSYADGSADDFQISTTNGSGSQTLSLAPGTYTITEITSPSSDWSQTSSTCTNVVVQSNAETDCAITNTYTAPSPQTGSLVVTKNTINGDGTFGFSIGSGSNAGFNITTSNGTGSYTINNLTPGDYTVTETNSPDANWSQTDDTCTNVSVTANQTAACTITNTYTTPAPTTGSITVIKNTSGADGTFGFSVTGQSDFNITTVNNTGTNTLNSLTPGDYTVAESGSLASGWTFDTASCQDSSEQSVGSLSANQVSFTLNAGDDIACTFDNVFTSGGGGGGGTTQYTLTITKSGDGDGTVSGASGDNQPTVFCNLNECKSSDEKQSFTQTYDAGTAVNLTVAPGEGSNFDGTWTTTAGTCTGNATPCSVTMNANVTLNAHFGLNPVTPPPPPPGGGGGGGGGLPPAPPTSSGIVLGITTPTPTPITYPGKVLGATLPRTGTPGWMVILAVIMAAGIVYSPKSIKSIKSVK